MSCAHGYEVCATFPQTNKMSERHPLFDCSLTESPRSQNWVLVEWGNHLGTLDYISSTCFQGIIFRNCFILAHIKNRTELVLVFVVCWTCISCLTSSSSSIMITSDNSGAVNSVKISSAVHQFQQRLVGSLLMGSLRHVLANLRGKAQTLEKKKYSQNQARKVCHRNVKNYPCRNYPVTSALYQNLVQATFKASECLQF